jgi:hypothetical protein
MNGEHQQLFTRRRVLQIGAVALASATVLGAPALASATPRKRVRYATKGLRRARFAPHVGTKVRLRPVGAPAVRARLVAVEDLAGDAVAHLSGSQHAYALRFRVPGPVTVAGATVGIRHPRFGVVHLFVTPSQSAVDGAPEVLAIVNRVVPRSGRGR